MNINTYRQIKISRQITLFAVQVGRIFLMSLQLSSLIAFYLLFYIVISASESTVFAANGGEAKLSKSEAPRASNSGHQSISKKLYCPQGTIELTAGTRLRIPDWVPHYDVDLTNGDRQDLVAKMHTPDSLKIARQTIFAHKFMDNFYRRNNQLLTMTINSGNQAASLDVSTFRVNLDRAQTSGGGSSRSMSDGPLGAYDSRETPEIKSQELRPFYGKDLQLDLDSATLKLINDEILKLIQSENSGSNPNMTQLKKKELVVSLQKSICLQNQESKVVGFELSTENCKKIEGECLEKPSSGTFSDSKGTGARGEVSQPEEEHTPATSSVESKRNSKVESQIERQTNIQYRGDLRKIKPGILIHNLEKTCASLKPSGGENFLRTLVRDAQKAGLPPEVLIAVMARESAGNCKAVGGGNSFGLFQFTRPTIRHYGKSGDYIYNPYTALRLAVKMLTDLNDKYSSIKNANDRWSIILTAYNSGEGFVRKARKQLLEFNKKIESVNQRIPSNQQLRPLNPDAWEDIRVFRYLARDKNPKIHVAYVDEIMGRNLKQKGSESSGSNPPSLVSAVRENFKDYLNN